MRLDEHGDRRPHRGGDEDEPVTPQSDRARRAAVGEGGEHAEEGKA